MLGSSALLAVLGAVVTSSAALASPTATATVGTTAPPVVAPALVVTPTRAVAAEAAPAPTPLVPEATTSTTIEVVDRRLDRSFDPHAARALTGRRIAELGATNLAEALEHLPTAFVRTAGRGGVQVDVRGARKGALLVLIDGMPISDPFFGNFDVASIPATDIAEIRVSNAPASPLDGPGGNGGVVEVITRSAVGKRRAFVRVSGGTAPGARVAASAKGDVAGGLAVRVSGSGAADARTFTVQPKDGPASALDQSGRAAHGALLVEHVGEAWRLGAELSAGTQGYLVPPSEDEGADLTVVDAETTVRGAVLGEWHDEDLRLSLRGFAHALERESHRFRDASLVGSGARALVEAARYGGLFRADWATTPTLTLLASGALVVETGRESGDGGDGADGAVTVLQAGAGGRWALTSWLTADIGVGAALPVEDGATPWPEARASLELTSTWVDVTLIGARKGRVPTLRERFQPNTGNPAIGPEQSSYGEAQVVLRPLEPAALTLSGWVRDISGVIKIPLGGNQLDNVGDLLTGGLDVRVDVALWSRAIELGGAYQLQAQDGESLYDFFPTHRGELWLRGRPARALELWARAKYLGDREDQGVLLGDVITLDVGAWLRLGPLRLHGRVENLADQAWLAHAGIPGFGRTVWLGLEAETP